MQHDQVRSDRRTTKDWLLLIVQPKPWTHRRQGFREVLSRRTAEELASLAKDLEKLSGCDDRRGPNAEMCGAQNFERAARSRSRRGGALEVLGAEGEGASD